MSYIGRGIDTGDDTIGVLSQHPEHSEGHAIRWPAVRGQGRTAIGQLCLVHPQGLVHRLAVTGSRPVVIGSEDDNLPYAFHSLLQCQQTRRMHIIIVRQQDETQMPTFLLSGRRRRLMISDKLHNPTSPRAVTQLSRKGVRWA